METKLFNAVISEFAEKINSVNEIQAGSMPADGSWSLKQIVGHLIDSATNLQQRIVRLLEGNLENFPTYNGAFWVNAQHYQQADWENLKTLWQALNRHLLYVMQNIPDESLANEWILEPGVGADLKWLIEDYFEHMAHHSRKFGSKSA